MEKKIERGRKKEEEKKHNKIQRQSFDEELDEEKKNIKQGIFRRNRG